jgi:hypothetical protein
VQVEALHDARRRDRRRVDRTRRARGGRDVARRDRTGVPRAGGWRPCPPTSSACRSCSTRARALPHNARRGTLSTRMPFQREALAQLGIRAGFVHYLTTAPPSRASTSSRAEPRRLRATQLSKRDRFDGVHHGGRSGNRFSRSSTRIPSRETKCPCNPTMVLAPGFRGDPLGSTGKGEAARRDPTVSPSIEKVGDRSRNDWTTHVRPLAPETLAR